MNDLLNETNDYYYGHGDRINCAVELYPQQKAIVFSFDDGSHVYYKCYTYLDAKKAHYFTNRIVKGIQAAAKKNCVLNLAFFNSISQARYKLDEIDYIQFNNLIHG